MPAFRLSFLVLAGVILVGFGLSAFIVDEREYALKFRFGEVIESEYEPGLHFKVPFVNNVRKLPRQILTIDTEPEEIITAEKKTVFVDFFLKYRITDPIRFYVSTGGGSEINAADRLLEIIKGAIRSEFSKRTVQEVVSVQRTGLMDDMLNTARTTAQELGVELTDLRVKRVEFSDDVADSVYERMREERNRIATELRAEGAEQAEALRAAADRQRTVIRAEAFREAQTIRGDGDAQAAEIYASAYQADADFYAFYRSIEAYRNAIGNGNDLLVLEPDSDFFRFLNDSDGDPSN
ncbi:MAG: protease modulator HflC [Pseudomonadota bacterium]